VNLTYLFAQSVKKAADGSLILDWGGQPPFGAPCALTVNDALAYPQVLPNCFSAEECRSITALGESRLKAGGSVEGRTDLGSRDYRVSDITWMEPAADNHWLYHRLGLLFQYINESYGFDLVGLGESLQYTSYGPGQFFDWHIDTGRGGASLRKLSLSIQLSTPEEYGGGQLQFRGVVDMPGACGQGSLVAFPSYLPHSVSPVEHGLRRSLMAWAYGPTYR